MFGMSGRIANSGMFSLVPNYMQIEDRGSNENYV